MRKNNLVKRLITVFTLVLVVVMSFSACGSKSGGNADASKDAGDSASTKWSSSNVDEILKTIPEDVKNKEIHVLMWRKYDAPEQKQVDDFMAKTGIKVRTTVTTEGEYNTKLLSLIAANDAPDVVCLESKVFPARIKGMQVLDAKTFRLDDEIWNKDYMNCFRVKDNYYSVSISGNWNTDDGIRHLVYNKQLLKDAGVTTTPYELYKAGQWNWDAMKNMLEKVAAYGKIGITHMDVSMHMQSAGADYVRYNPDTAKFELTLDDAETRATIENAWSKIAEIKATPNLLYDFMKITEFARGDYAFMSTIAYTFLKDGGHLTNFVGGPDNVESVPYPGPTQATTYVPYSAKTWGVGKGADNAEGAAYFLRYFLDNTTFDFEGSFYNEQFKEAFKILTAKNTKRIHMVGQGVADYVTPKTYKGISTELSDAAKGQVTTILDKHKGTLANSVDKINNDLNRLLNNLD